jgi:hypothetical protein
MLAEYMPRLISDIDWLFYEGTGTDCIHDHLFSSFY